MRIEKSSVNNYVHVYNRGVRKIKIFNGDGDYWRFLLLLRYFNNQSGPTKALQELFWLNKSNLCEQFEWPKKWPSQKPIVEIIAYCLMPNHFHLLFREIQPNGIASFMQKIGTGYTNYFNAKYKESGRLFQGTYKAKIIGSEEYLQYIDAYIQVFNPFELINSRTITLKNFDAAFKSATQYQFCSLGESFGIRNFSIINRNELKNRFPSVNVYKNFSKDAFLSKDLQNKMPEFSNDILMD